MMHLEPKKSIASVIIAKMKPDFVQKIGEKSPDKSFEDIEGTEKDYDMGLRTAMEEFLKCSKEGDVEGCIESMKSFFSMIDEVQDAKMMEEGEA